MRLLSSRPAPFTLRLRIPAWARPGEVRISVNGKRIPVRIENGFAKLQRRWLNGDRIELQLELPVRLQPIDLDHPNTVAMVRGPLVLFAVEGTPASVSRRQLLAAERRPEEAAWQVATSSGPMLFRPFLSINDEPYRTYLSVD
jgi:DUF1680 family protein